MMTYKEVLNKVGKKKFDPIYFLCGEESYFTDRVVEKLQDVVLSEEEQAFNEVTLYGKDVDDKDLLDHLMRYPMMAPYQLVVLKEAQAFSKWDGLISYFKDPNAQTVFVIAYKAKSPDKRKKWVKALNGSSHCAYVESKKVYDNQLSAWIDTYAQSMGYTVEPSASQLLSIYLGADLSRVSSELQKIFIGKSAGSKITLNDIEQNIGISKIYNVFELLNALGSRNISKTNFILTNMIDHLNSQPVQLVLPAIHRFFQKVYALKSIQSTSDQVIAKQLNIYSTYFVKDYKIASKYYNHDQLEQIFDLCYKYDIRSKGINGSRQKDADILVELVERILYV